MVKPVQGLNISLSCRSGVFNVIRKIRVTPGPRGGKKRLKKRLHKPKRALYKCAHEHPTPQYSTRRTGCTRPGDLAAAKRDDCRRFLARARHASCAGR